MGTIRSLRSPSRTKRKIQSPRITNLLTNGKRDLFYEVKAIIDRQEINNMEHLLNKRGASIKNQFDEFKNMFKDLRKEKQKLQEDDTVPYFGSHKVEPPNTEELEKYQKIIDDLVIKRYNDEDNAFLRITEMDYFEQFKVYQDKYPLFRIRMKIWNAYMYSLCDSVGSTSLQEILSGIHSSKVVPSC